MEDEFYVKLHEILSGSKSIEEVKLEEDDKTLLADWCSYWELLNSEIDEEKDAA